MTGKNIPENILGGFVAHPGGSDILTWKKDF